MAAPGKTLTAANVPLLTAHGMVAATQHDTNTISPMPFGFRADAAGDVKFRDSLGNDVTVTVVPGEVILCLLDMIYDTGTSLADADIHLLY